MAMDNSYAVAIFGIPDFEREMVERIFSVSQSRDHVYRIVDQAEFDTAEIALLDKSDADAAGRYDQLQSQRQALPTVLVASSGENGCEYWVKRPFTVTRMLGALDRLVEEQLSGADRRSAPEAPTRLDSPAPAGINPGTYTALVVDDSLPVRQQVSVALRRASITAEFAESGEQALQLIEARRYDIVFLDIVLPGKDGYEVCKALKSNEKTKHIPIVMLTAKSSASDRIKGEVAGCDAYLTKPVSLEAFDKTLCECLDPPPTFQSKSIGA